MKLNGWQTKYFLGPKTIPTTTLAIYTFGGEVEIFRQAGAFLAAIQQYSVLEPSPANEALGTFTLYDCGLGESATPERLVYRSDTPGAYSGAIGSVLVPAAPVFPIEIKRGILITIGHWGQVGPQSINLLRYQGMLYYASREVEQ
jgi:hypothetical protein